MAVSVEDVKSAAAAFGLFDQDTIKIAKSDTCLTNETYFISGLGSDKRYILQTLNKTVFKRPHIVMSNIRLVLAHIRGKVEQRGGDVSREAVSLVTTLNGETFHVDKAGEIFRAYKLIDNIFTRSYSDEPEVVGQAASCFADFSRMLMDFDPSLLSESIPDFHDISYLYGVLDSALSEDLHLRADTAKSEIDFAGMRKRESEAFIQHAASAKLPQRVIHNDYRLSNILLDKPTGKPLCVLDFDLLMPGWQPMDLARALVYSGCSCREDEEDLEKCVIDLRLFEEVSKICYSKLKKWITRQEKDLLPMFLKQIAFESGLRYLIDYLCGDIYYKAARPRQNLARARVQFKIVEEVEKNWNSIQTVIKKL